jgi:hypothetical protein
MALFLVLHEMSATDILIARLDGVRKRGAKGWLCKCPAHDDGTPSLTIREAADGTILIHCFAGCDPNDVLAAVGMNIRDLFPEKLDHHIEKKRSGISPFDALRAVRHEILVVELLAADMAKGLCTPDLKHRAQLSVDRINTVLAICDD